MAKKQKQTKPLEGLGLLTSSTYMKKYKILAKRVSKKPDLNFKFGKNLGSYTNYDNATKKFSMNIDPWQMDKDIYALESKDMIIRGLIYHESWHLLFTDFIFWNQNHALLKQSSQKIGEIADDLLSANPTKTKEELTEAIYQFYFDKYMFDMLNSVEDASIEASGGAMFPEGYVNIVFLRNETLKMEWDFLEKEYNSLTYPFVNFTIHDYMTIITAIITEIRAMATIGYRKNLQYNIVNHLFDDDTIKEMEDVALWCRLCAVNTQERYIGAKTLLSFLKDKVMYPFAELMTDNYLNDLESLKKRIEDEQNKTDSANENNQSLGQSQSASGQISQGGAGKARSDLPIPKSLSDKMKEEIEEELHKAKQNQASQKEQAQKNESNESSSHTQEIQNQEYSKDILDKETEKLLQEALKNSAKSFEKTQDTIDKKRIEGGMVLAANAAEHKGVSVVEGKIEDFSDNKMNSTGAEVYKEVPKLLEYVNPLSKNMKKILMRRAQNRCLKGQYVGKLDMKSLYRANTDGRVFKKETEGQKSNVRFCILVDESGSMAGRRIEQAIKGCYIVAKAAQRLKIPFAVYGHTDANQFELRQYVDYNNCLKKDVVNNIFKMKSRHCNRDGLAIYKTLSSLVNCRNNDDEQKILIVISDGQPNGGKYSYGGESAIREMQSIMNKFEKLYGVKTIGIGIGSDCNCVQSIYKNNILVEDVSELPSQMINLLKQIVL